MPSSFRQKLQHEELKGNGVHFMAYDAAPDTPLSMGNQINMSIDVDNLDEGKKLFKDLASGGQVHHEFRECEWVILGGVPIISE